MSDNKPERAEIALTVEELRQVTQYAAACAREVLPLFAAVYPHDSRPREAIAAAEAFATGTQPQRTAALRAVAWAAYNAAREVEKEAPIAAQAAYAASHAAAAAYLHPLADPNQVKHILGAAVHQALAFELGARADGDTDRDIGGERLQWAADSATPTVRDVLRRYPPPLRRGRGRFHELLCALDAALRDSPGTG